MRTGLVCAVVCGAMLIVGRAQPAWADGFIVADEAQVRPPTDPHPRFPHMPLAVRYHRVRCDIREGVAVTRIDQAFANDGARPIEGTYVFPLDDDIALSRFTMYMNGREVVGKVLDKETARREYESIVARMKDPALLEYVGSRMYKVRIFPIPAKGEVRVTLEYAQTLSIDDGLVRYRYPLNTERFSAKPIDEVSVVVKIDQAQGIKSVFSPSHEVAVQRTGETGAGVSFEARKVLPDTDFELYYALGDKPIGLTLLTHRLAGEDGYFLARVSPPARPSNDQVVAKDICFVVDTSGSMAGAKMEQAIRALKFCVSNLNPKDRFSVVPFAHEPQPWREALAKATPENVAQARKFAGGLKGIGGTNIRDALLSALAARPADERERPYLIVFLTDGQPTVGVTDENTILADVEKANSGAVRLFVFGVGDDVNTRLLDVLAEKNRGARDYIGNQEDIELKVSAFYRKVAEPVLSDLQINWGGLTTLDVFPARLPDLFAGSEIVLMGRYRGDGGKLIELTGRQGDKKLSFSYEKTFPETNGDHPYLPRLWAIRKVGFLLDQIRQHGENEELKSSIIALAQEFGIITPYTSYLVREEAKHVAVGTPGRQPLHDVLESEEAAGRVVSGLFRERMAKKAGSAAVQQSAQNQAMRDNVANVGFDYALAAPADADEAVRTDVRLIKQVGRRIFVNAGRQWIQNDIDQTAKRQQVALFSRDYFELANQSREVARMLAVARTPVFEWNGQVIEIVETATE